MTEFDLPDFSSVDSTEFAQIIGSSSDSKLARVMQGELRNRILDEVFARMPASFRPNRAGSTSMVIHWVVTGRPGGGADTYEMAIADGACTVSGTPRQEPRLTLTLGPVEFLKVVSGNANAVMLFMTGKLKATGDLALAANIGSFFALPKA